MKGLAKHLSPSAVARLPQIAELVFQHIVREQGSDGCFPPRFADLNPNSELYRRCVHKCAPIYLWCHDQYHTMKKQASQDMHPTVFIGISAPQGCGKTAIVSTLSHLFKHDGLRCVALSLDDFYLTHSEQAALASAHPTNRLLQERGNAGTHDVELCRSALHSLRSTSGPVSLPTYDKSMHHGKGDRGKAYEVQSPVDVVLFEGWMLGFEAQGIECVDPNSDLAIVNELLRQYGSLNSIMDAWILFKAENIEWVYDWRLEAEHELWTVRGSGKSDAEVRAFVDLYMPAYHQYLPALHSRTLGPANHKPTMHIPVAKDRSVRLI